MALSMTYVRPDRVTKTGVIAPYPIRQNNPVALARNVIKPFINDIRPGGAGLGSPTPQMVDLPGMPSNPAAAVLMRARRVMQGVPNGQRSVPRNLMNARRAVVRKTAQGNVAPYEYDAARADRRWERAASRGTTWDMIFARQYMAQLMRR